MKFVSILKAFDVQGICIKYTLCTKMGTKEFDAVLAMISDDVEDSIRKISPIIKRGSCTEMTVEEIAGELFRNAVTRFVSADKSE